MFSQTRGLERFDLELPALVEVIDSKSLKTYCYPMTRNLSGDGGYFHTHNPLPEKTKIKVGLILQINKPTPGKGNEHFFLEFTGQVIRVDENGMAVSFDRNYKHISITPSD